MNTAYLVVAGLAVLANGFSGIAALFRIPAALPPMQRVGVPTSWMRFPIGVLKTAGMVGLALGLAGVPHVGTAAAAGLVLFFSCAVHTHLLARDYTFQFGLAIGFLTLNVATLTLDLVS